MEHILVLHVPPILLVIVPHTCQISCAQFYAVEVEHLEEGA